MGMDLYRVKDQAYFRWANHFWFAVLDLAERYGWKPENHILPTWGSTVSDEDAETMASALERAISDVPDEQAVADKKGNLIIDTVDQNMFPWQLPSYVDVASLLGGSFILGGGFTPRAWKKLNCFEKLAVAKPELKAFIAYLREGAFKIY